MSEITRKKKLNNSKKFSSSKKKGHLLEKEEISTLQKQRLKGGDLGLDSTKIKLFEEIPMSSKTNKGLQEGGFTIPTKVQSQSLIYSLQGLDVVVAAKTGSGKTLAFLIPVLEVLYSQMWSNVDGLGALIITPTRELAYQIFEVLNIVGKYHCFSAGLVIGGKDLKFEWSRINKCNIMICTPGRLLQHMTQNPEFNYENVQLVILDEADQCLSMGFAETMNLILDQLPSDRQTLLFSATQTRDVNDLIRAGCKNPIFCSVHEYSQSVTPKTLKESYVVCEEYSKITFLWSFLKHHKRHKILVFLATCKQVKFILSLFTHLRPGLTVMGLHGSMHQLRRLAIYDEFCKKKHAVLFATDVAARGLDIPSVDWVVQLDCPEDATTYIHRAGRTARHVKSGEALLVLSASQEEPMLSCLKEKNLSIEKIEVDYKKLQDIHLKIEAALSKFVNLKEEAVRAFKAYLKNISLMKNKRVFNVMEIDLDAFARSLGMAVTPRVRFVERKLKNAPKIVPKENVEKTLKTFNLGLHEDESDDEFLTSSKKNNEGLSSSNAEADLSKEDATAVSKKIKVVTKYAVVKKLKKKFSQLNKKVTFDEEGEPILDPCKDMSGNYREAAMTEGGIDLNKMEEVLREEDKVDKRRHQEKVKVQNRLKKDKEKADKRAMIDEKIRAKASLVDPEPECSEASESEEEDVDTQNIIDELPDPDKVYEKKRRLLSDGESDSDEESCSDNERTSNLNTSPGKSKEARVFSGKIEARKRAKESKRMKLAESNDLQTIPFGEKEDLALFLLKRGR